MGWERCDYCWPVEMAADMCLAKVGLFAIRWRRCAATRFRRDAASISRYTLSTDMLCRVGPLHWQGGKSAHWMYLRPLRFAVCARHMSSLRLGCFER